MLGMAYGSVEVEASGNRMGLAGLGKLFICKMRPLWLTFNSNTFPFMSSVIRNKDNLKMKRNANTPATNIFAYCAH
jgi:hypothetical protein